MRALPWAPGARRRVRAPTAVRLLPPGNDQLGPDNLLEDALGVPLTKRSSQLPLEVSSTITEVQGCCN